MVTRARAGRSGALVVSGEAGVGKTALLDQTAARAAAHVRVERMLASESEMELAYSGLQQLCGHMMSAAGHLPAPYTILRATQFFEFLPQIVEAGAEGDGLRLPTAPMQFVAADDVAATVVELATAGPAGGRVELGGPETLGIDAWGKRLLAATGDGRTVISDPHARYFGTEVPGGELTARDGARIGSIGFDTWFAAQPQNAEQ